MAQEKYNVPRSFEARFVTTMDQLSSLRYDAVPNSERWNQPSPDTILEAAKVMHKHVLDMENILLHIMEDVEAFIEARDNPPTVQVGEDGAELEIM